MKAEINPLQLDAIGLKKHLDLDNICYCWRTYTPDMGFDYSETNQLIHNFQISVLEEDSRKQYYRVREVFL